MANSEVHLKDYRPLDFCITDVELEFRLADIGTHVTSRLHVERIGKGSELILNGENLILDTLTVDGKEFPYEMKEGAILLKPTKDKFLVEVHTIIDPISNKALEGLYKSGSIFCTQCEAVGFRRITYFQDRPDNMARFTTKIIADKALYPILLSNGNLQEKGDLEGGLHYAIWKDPSKKPCYLFALVAGDLGVIKDHFITMSGRKVALEIYCDKGNEEKCYHAMESLKKSMKWDETRFGIEYDLDIYMIVAVDSFNMGAMENKGLNIFNSVYVLAKKETATDADFYGIESVIGHEYFHNQTGNRITCRDWFQLTLKEGLTVFRDQEFSADHNPRGICRVKDVQKLRSRQFSEDAGPLSHPIKPKKYSAIDNFYTATIYEKGAEVIRMLETLLTKEGFTKGMKKYVELFDGMAITTEDFLHAMSVANHNFDMTQFKLWYQQNGTPLVHAELIYDKTKKEAELTLTQKPTMVEGKVSDQPLLIPLKIALFNEDGESFSLPTDLILLKNFKESFKFFQIASKPILSLNRGFTAPIKLTTNQEEEDLIALMSFDSDFFNRKEAHQLLAQNVLNELIELETLSEEPFISRDYIEAFRAILLDKTLDTESKANLMSLPAMDMILATQNPLNVSATHAAYLTLVETIASECEEELFDLVGRHKENSVGDRALNLVCLSYLSSLHEKKYLDLIFAYFKNAKNMTEEVGALGIMIHHDHPQADLARDMFYKKWKDETLVIQKLFTLESGKSSPTTLTRVKELENDPCYDKTVPNLVRSLYRSFMQNPVAFHSEVMNGYEYMAERIIEIDSYNHQLAANLMTNFKDYKRLPSKQQDLMRDALLMIQKHPTLSSNSRENVERFLAT